MGVVTIVTYKSFIHWCSRPVSLLLFFRLFIILNECIVVMLLALGAIIWTTFILFRSNFLKCFVKFKGNKMYTLSFLYWYWVIWAQLLCTFFITEGCWGTLETKPGMSMSSNMILTDNIISMSVLNLMPQRGGLLNKWPSLPIQPIQVALI